MPDGAVLFIDESVLVRPKILAVFIFCSSPLKCLESTGVGSLLKITPA